MRGGAPISFSSRSVLRATSRIVLGLLAVLVAVLALQAAQHNSEIHALKTRGAQVEVTVESCFGILTGTGIQATGYQCQGSFLLDGLTYSDVIHGSSQLYSPGSHLAGVTDPRKTSQLYTAESVEHAPPAKHSYLIAMITGGILLLGIIGEILISRRRRAD